MSPLLVFILVVSICQFAQLHYKAGKRIKALEKEVEDLNNSFSEFLKESTVMAESMTKIARRVHSQELELMKNRLVTKQENNNGNA